MKGKTVAAIAFRNTASAVSSRVLLYGGPGAIRLVGGTAFYIVLAFASARRGVAFGATLAVIYTLFTFVSNTGFNWFEQSYLRYQDETIARAAGRISLIIGAIAFIPALYTFRAFAPAYVLTLVLLFAAATMFEATFRFTIAHLIVQRRERRYSQLVLLRATMESGGGVAAILLARSDRQAIAAVFVGLVVARIFATDRAFIFHGKGRPGAIPRIPMSWFIYGGSLTILLAIYQAVVIYVQHEADLANSVQSGLVVGQKYIQQVGQVVSAIMLVSLAPRLFAVNAAMRARVLGKISVIYSVIVIVANGFLVISAIVLAHRVATKLDMGAIVAFFIGSTALSLSVMSHKSFEIIERPYLCVVLMLVASLITVLWMAYVKRSNPTAALVIGFTAAGPLYYFGSAVLDILHVRISTLHAVFHACASSLLLGAMCVIVAKGFAQ